MVGGKFVSSIAHRSKLVHGYNVNVFAYVRCECTRDGTRRDGWITYIYVDCVAMGATIIYNAQHSAECACLHGATQRDETAPIMNPRSNFLTWDMHCILILLTILILFLNIPIKFRRKITILIIY